MPVTSLRMGHLWDALARAYNELGVRPRGRIPSHIFGLAGPGSRSSQAITRAVPHSLDPEASAPHSVADGRTATAMTLPRR